MEITGPKGGWLNTSQLNSCRRCVDHWACVWQSVIVQQDNISIKHFCSTCSEWPVTISAVFCSNAQHSPSFLWWGSQQGEWPICPRTLCIPLSAPTKSAWISSCREVHCDTNALTAAWFLGYCAQPTFHHLWWSSPETHHKGADFYDLKTRIYACIYDLKNIKIWPIKFEIWFYQ